MNNSTTPPGSVFVSYAHDDLGRVEPIVKLLADNGFDVWWDKNIEVGTSFRSAIDNSLDEAACVVVIWTNASVESDFVRSEASRGQDRGVLLPILLDSTARIPVGFTEIQYLDLTNWDGIEHQSFQSLLARISSLVARGPNKTMPYATLPHSQWYFDNSRHIVSQMRDLTSQIRSISHLLVSNYAPIEDLKGALREVSKTYNVVNSAITQFTKSAVGTGPIDPAPFLEIEGGSLKTQIKNGHGHCGQILTYYGRYGGIRDWIQDKLSPEDFQETDRLFARLGTADGDLFRPLEEIGDILTNESGVIVNLLLAGQEDLARQRIRDGRLKLAPLREDLATAMGELQDLEHSLGYADPAG